MRESLDIVGQFLTADEILLLYKQLLKMMMDSDGRKAENEKLVKDEETAEDEKNFYEQDIET